MWEMKNQRTWYELDRKKQQWDAMNNASGLWEQWRGIYCSLSSPDATYKDLEGKKQRCR